MADIGRPVPFHVEHVQHFFRPEGSVHAKGRFCYDSRQTRSHGSRAAAFARRELRSGAGIVNSGGEAR